MARAILCLHCAVRLTPDDREHYVYACHACVVREHDEDRRAGEGADAFLPAVEWLRPTAPQPFASRPKGSGAAPALVWRNPAPSRDNSAKRARSTGRRTA